MALRNPIMEKEQESMQFVGVSGVFNHSYQTILTGRAIFFKITLTLILPLAFVFLANEQVSDLLVKNLASDAARASASPEGSNAYEELFNDVPRYFGYLLLTKLIYFTIAVVLSLLSNAAVVYTIACIYTSREVTFKGVMRVVPKVWKKQFVTFLSLFVLFFAISMAAVFIYMIWVLIFGIKDVVLAGLSVLLVYLVCQLYLVIISQLAFAVAVLEDAQGFQAIGKSRDLIKGKIWVSIVVSVVLGVVQVLTFSVFTEQVVKGELMLWRISFGLLYLVLFSMSILVNLVAQTIIYFVCKSYRNEKIEKSSLSDHLEVYTFEYVPLTSKAVELEKYSV